ncbi:M23 family metallopeptidase [Marimonas arenosa]|uniref:M23 family metallopeptidase n=1 Tax=Marimonas arenosa TaxID=1795305 RepID=A0AAE3WCG4_9RHOB|nr:M23 family metallopeptidase [Marimonas arenosa]MDQ2090174.1 M23 family metallopeptidase [Marimonas arenosa]
MRAVLIGGCLAAGSALAADPPVLQFPLDCTLGETCFIEDYVDHDPDPGKISDFACGLNTRDSHKGTDIALLRFDDIEAGVTVRAAAPGRVWRTRDGMRDDWREKPGVTAENACGNAVILDHGDGWQSVYCHLRQGSIRVADGDRVYAGAALGLVGLSGRTTHPHLHLSLYRNGALVDPFRPDGGDGCGPAGASLWADPPAYHATLLRRAGFSDHVPDHDDLRDGSARRDRIAPDAPLVVYAEAGHARPGDQITITATGPEGEIFRDTRILSDPKPSQLPAFGRKAPPGGWPEGAYLGEILLTRAGLVIAHRFAHVKVAGP